MEELIKNVILFCFLIERALVGIGQIDIEQPDDVEEHGSIKNKRLMN
ncbi:hypothetical protein [Bacteroides sp.]